MIMRPVDTDDIQANIDRLLEERREISDELDELDELKGQLPSLEEERQRLKNEIKETREELEELETEIDERDADVDQSRDDRPNWKRNSRRSDKNGLVSRRSAMSLIPKRRASRGCERKRRRWRPNSTSCLRPPLVISTKSSSDRNVSDKQTATRVRVECTAERHRVQPGNLQGR